jgi:uncharacterized protein YqgQ
MAGKEKSELRQMIDEYGIKDMNDVHEFVKMYGEFEPQLVKKRQTDVSAIEDKVIFLYSQEISTRDIQKTMREMYGIDVDDSRVSKITDKILPLVKEWQERPLQSVYAMVILDAVHYNVRENGIVTKRRPMWRSAPIWKAKRMCSAFGWGQASPQNTGFPF